jgi:hypothetical protein
MPMARRPLFDGVLGLLRDLLVDRKIAAAGRRQRNAQVADRLAAAALVGEHLADADDVGVDRRPVVRIDAIAEIERGTRRDGCRVRGIRGDQRAGDRYGNRKTANG